jgi:hypothetical protein
MKQRAYNSRFTDGLNHNYFTNGLITSYTDKVEDESMREHIWNDLEHLIDTRRNLFKEGPLSGYMHEIDEDSTEEFLVRCVYEAWESMVLNPPGLFRINPCDPRREMLSLMWDVDHFLDTISEWAADVDGLLDRFEHLDKTSDTMRLITHNYVNMMIKKCQGHTKQEQETIIRDLRIEKTLR